jgi:hypothetical protein
MINKKILGALQLPPNLCPNVVNENLDEHGNQFRYRAKVKDQHGAQVSRWAWDVFLIVTP